MSWREHCKPIIAQVLRDNAGKTEKEINKALRDAYPYGERKYHPYKIWCDEIRVQKNLKKFGRKPANPDPNQQNLF